jgi:hypothetical protein
MFYDDKIIGNDIFYLKKGEALTLLAEGLKSLF